LWKMGRVGQGAQRGVHVKTPAVQSKRKKIGGRRGKCRGQARSPGAIGRYLYREFSKQYHWSSSNGRIGKAGWLVRWKKTGKGNRHWCHVVSHWDKGVVLTAEKILGKKIDPAYLL